MFMAAPATAPALIDIGAFATGLVTLPAAQIRSWLVLLWRPRRGRRRMASRLAGEALTDAAEGQSPHAVSPEDAAFAWREEFRRAP
jgi:hypothetical protein